jgi:hypothetical protein
MQKRNSKIMNGVPYNQCTKCEEWFEATEEYFYFRKSSKSLYPWCRKCQSINRRERMLTNIEAHHSYHLLYNREYRKRSEVKLKLKLKLSREKNKEKQKAYVEKNRERLLIYYKEYNRKNIEKRTSQKREYYKQNKIEIDTQKKVYQASRALFVYYAHRLTIDEDPKDDGNGYLLVKCAYCGKYFHPITQNVYSRIRSLEGSFGGDNRLYCSLGCKDACPIYRQVLWPKGFKPATSREVDPLIRQMCLKRDNYTCQKCEKTINEIEIHSHHIEGVVQMPMLANDVENTITLCIDCHTWVHQQDGCTYYDLRCKK